MYRTHYGVKLKDPSRTFTKWNLQVKRREKKAKNIKLIIIKVKLKKFINRNAISASKM